MSNAEPQAAHVREIKAACPAITSDKVLEFAESGKTLEQCKDSWMQELATENEALREQNEDLQAKLSEAEKQAKESQSLGVEPVSHKPSEESSREGSATEEFQSLVEAKVAAGLPRAKAASAVVRAHPELHKQMIAEANAR